MQSTPAKVGRCGKADGRIVADDTAWMFILKQINCSGHPTWSAISSPNAISSPSAISRAIFLESFQAVFRSGLITASDEIRQTGRQTRECILPQLCF